MPAWSGAACVRCGDVLARTETAALCRACRLAPPPFVKAVAHGRYEGRLKAAIHALKYEGMYPAGGRLGQMLAGAIATLAGEAPRQLLVIPVPLHRDKYARRGFNQAQSLAGHALSSLRKSHPAWELKLAPRALTRWRATDTQAGLTPRQRRLNVRGAFAVSAPSKVARKDVLLVDDILTTGATVRAAAQALLRAGAESVWVATLARAHRYALRDDAFRHGTGADFQTADQAAAAQAQASGPADLEFKTNAD